MKPLLLLLFVACALACEGPLFATVSHNGSEDMWRAHSLITEYDPDGAPRDTYPQLHWETRTITTQCVLHRTVYLPVDRFVFIYRQKIFPPVENVYQVQEYLPHTGRYVVVDCQVKRVDERTINVSSTFTLERQITVDQPHESYHERVRMDVSETSTLFAVVPPALQNVTIAEVRALFEQGRIIDAVLEPMPAFVHKLY